MSGEKQLSQEYESSDYLNILTRDKQQFNHFDWYKSCVKLCTQAKKLSVLTMKNLKNKASDVIFTAIV